MAAHLQDLLGLWRGDEDSYGYAHERLAYEICKRLPTKPKTADELLRQLYPDAEDLAEVEKPVRVLVAKAFVRWREENKRR